MLVLGRPGTLHSSYRIVQMVDQGRRRESGFERSSIHERLEGGSRLAFRLNGAIEAALVEVTAADHRADVTRLGFERDEGGLKRGLVRRQRRPSRGVPGSLTPGR